MRSSPLKLLQNSAFNYWRGDAPPGHKQLYHGTSTHNAGGILQHGLRASRNGTLGRGVYFTDNKETAMAIARYRARQTGGGRAVVVLCDVPEAHTRNTAMHAPWAGVSRDFREYCVNEKEVTVRAVEPVPP
uniref:PARP catalytic domain-containing protein n=1 Tax=Chromera velia CCMP2878 TaxID=1169474 RepID=A0A0G4FP21_9ALVE|eukprot:Cvel_3565.t1-p1 / transcript=Cvel_3565.t1 / gene=Cvel_3565 / organism=Chromera_velia_CCMP2878 / gene_product=hypothetical protein / transcript_product=hypothetical protein / location=Cvel_scaffold146:4470-4859(+) / protein_length=130 / sequence_SO=supercontig / SO=protein_coding / is_pseudo=false